MQRRSPLINVMVRAADRAARGLKRDFGEVENLQVSRKGPADFVSTADMRAEEVLRGELAKARPEYGFLMEESGSRPSRDEAERRWIVDPLDGTSNFLHGIPHFAVSLAMEERGELVAGVVYDPVKDEMFWAERGLGAFLNDRRLRVSGRTRTQDCLFGTGIPFKGHGEHEVFLGELRAVMAVSAGVRRAGTASLDLAYVAAGRLDGFWERDLYPWDMAAGVVLVREAGGYVSDMDARPLNLSSGRILASNGHVHDVMRDLLAVTDA